MQSPNGIQYFDILVDGDIGQGERKLQNKTRINSNIVLL